MGMTNLEGPGKGGLYSRTGLMISPVEEDRVQNMETDVQLTTQHRLHLLQKNIPYYSDLVHVIRVAGSGSYSYILYSTVL